MNAQSLVAASAMGNALWKAGKALERAFRPVVGKPTYQHSFKFTIVQQICHQVTVAGNSENEARTLALTETCRRRSHWLTPLEILAHRRLSEDTHITAVERLQPPSDNDLLWPSIMP